MRVSEVYASVQGEGPRVGAPTIFVRFAGCNLRCPGWPCDTPHAIDPALYRKEWRNIEPLDLYELVAGQPHYNTIQNICLTGGEPFLQPHNELESFVQDLMEDGKTIECFSNGTLEYPLWAAERIKFVMDWKLPGSGEVYKIEDLPNSMMYRNYQLLYDSYGHAVKFTVASKEDFEYARSIWSILPKVDMDVYVSPVWGAVEPKELVTWLLDSGEQWKLNMQVHNFIWDRNQRGI